MLSGVLTFFQGMTCGEENHASITEQATRDQEAASDPQSKQIGYFQVVERRAWESLADKDKEKWTADVLQD
jgi:hypothetical protein